MRAIQALALVIVGLAMCSCIPTGSRYRYVEEGVNYKVEASANIQTNSETVDLEVYVVQNGEVVKYIHFGKEGTDNTAALEVQAGAVDSAAEAGMEAVRGLFTLPWLQ
ncbi:MAG: hypothetical protein Q8N34_03270 [Gammaproteobacteria bacterium]|nr:hypothetical protein [Gammaproteobacteria bacterium]